MFKLLIAEDEQLEREALKFIISKSVNDVVDIEEAVNGREAISKSQASRPDIVILDINMPGINGLDAAWKIREKDPEVIIIFLTAFHQFDYAHEAIKIGVEDYIIKPSSEKRIIDVIEKVVEKLKKKKTRLREMEDIEIRLDKATDYLSSEFTYNLATRHMSSDKFLNYLTLLDMDFTYGRGIILKLNYDSYPLEVNSDYQKHILKRKSVRVITNMLKQKNICCTINLDLNNIYMFAFSQNENTYLEDVDFIYLSNTISQKVKENMNLEVLWGVGSLFNTADKAIESFSLAKTVLSNLFKGGEISKTLSELPLELEMNFEQVIISGDKVEFEVMFTQLEQWIKLTSISITEKKNYLIGLISILKHAASKQFPNGKCDIEYNDVLEASNDSEFINGMKHFLNNLLLLIIEMYDNENTPAIKLACDYIDDHYQDDISLEDVANYCNLSTFYFSKIFKKEKRQNFINYLTGIRIKRAKTLLEESNLSIKEITNAIGYKDPNYFTRVFKKEVECSPTDFRSKKMLKGQKK